MCKKHNKRFVTISKLDETKGMGKRKQKRANTDLSFISSVFATDCAYEKLTRRLILMTEMPNVCVLLLFEYFSFLLLFLFYFYILLPKILYCVVVVLLANKQSSKTSRKCVWVYRSALFVTFLYVCINIKCLVSTSKHW